MIRKYWTLKTNSTLHFTSGLTMEQCRLLWKTSQGRKFQRLTDFSHSNCRLSFSVQYKRLPFLLVCPGGNNPEVAERCVIRLFYVPTRLTNRLPNCFGSHLYILSDRDHLSPFIAHVQHKCNEGYEAVVMRNFQHRLHRLPQCTTACRFGRSKTNTLGNVTLSLHSAHVQWGWWWYLNAASSLQCRCPSVIKHPGARYSSRCQQKRYDNACVQLSV